MLGYDPGEFPRYLMKLCSNLFVEDKTLKDPKELLMRAFDILQDKTCYGIFKHFIFHLINVLNAYLIIYR